MKTRWIFASCVFLLTGALLLACHSLVPPPSYVAATVTLDKGTLIRFMYWPHIKKEPELRRQRYYLGGVQVREVDCPGPRCDRLVWETKSDSVWHPSQPGSDAVSLPESITYGEMITGMQTVVAAESLREGTGYSVVIGIMAMDETDESKIYFAAQSLFSLEKDDVGKLHITENPWESQDQM